MIMKKTTKATKQAPLFPEEVDLPLGIGYMYLRQVSFGAFFVSTDPKYKEVYQRVKPVNFLLNSNLVNDCINRDKVFVVNIQKGTLFIAPGNRIVKAHEKA